MLGVLVQEHRLEARPKLVLPQDPDAHARPEDLAGKYVGGEDLSAALATVQQLNAKGVKGSLNFYGMHAHQAGKAEHAADEAITALRRIEADGVDSNISVKLTTIGLDVGEDYCRIQLRRILDCASETDGFVRVDLEESPYLDQTLRIFEEMRVRYGARTVGPVIQSCGIARPTSIT